jgi:hypothetical protein
MMAACTTVQAPRVVWMDMNYGRNSGRFVVSFLDLQSILWNWVPASRVIDLGGPAKCSLPCRQCLDS